MRLEKRNHTSPAAYVLAPVGAVVFTLIVSALLVHGALHAQGWDHETSEADAEATEAHESAILQALGLPDPYAGG